MYAEQFKWQVRNGAGQGTSSIETSISMAALHWRKEREGGWLILAEGKDKKGRMLNIHIFSPISANTGQGKAVITSPQHCPKSAGASRALESLYHAAGNDGRIIA